MYAPHREKRVIITELYAYFVPLVKLPCFLKNEAMLIFTWVPLSIWFIYLFLFWFQAHQATCCLWFGVHVGSATVSEWPILQTSSIFCFNPVISDDELIKWLLIMTWLLMYNSSILGTEWVDHGNEYFKLSHSLIIINKAVFWGLRRYMWYSHILLVSVSIIF